MYHFVLGSERSGQHLRVGERRRRRRRRLQLRRLRRQHVDDKHQQRNQRRPERPLRRELLVDAGVHVQQRRQRPQHGRRHHRSLRQVHHDALGDVGRRAGSGGGICARFGGKVSKIKLTFCSACMCCE